MNILISGNYGANNLGDELILGGIIAQLKKNYSNPHITVLSGNPQQTIKDHHVNAVPMVPAGVRSHIKQLFKPNKTRQAFLEADHFILGGGGLFTKLSRKANNIWFNQAITALKHQVPLHMIGQSVDLYPNKRIKRKVKYLFEHAKQIILRDKQSQTRLQQLQIKTPISIQPDFALTPYKTKTKRNKQIAVALRGPNLKEFPDISSQKILEFLMHYQNLHYQITFINFHPHQDSPLHQYFQNKLSDKTKVTILTPKTHQQVHQLFASSELALTMRLHSAIVAINTQTPFLAINYAPKVKDLLTDLHLQKNILNFQQTLSTAQPLTPQPIQHSSFSL